MPIRVGILMGGASREREISFAGGRTVYDNLDKALFEPVALFADSFNKVVQLHWQNLYKGTIRDFFPPKAVLPQDVPFQYYIEQLVDNEADERYTVAINAIGTPLAWEEITHRVDLVFLTLHGAWGEDGSIQGLLEWHGIPYTGSGVFGSAMGMDKIRQRKWLKAMGFASPDFCVVNTWENLNGIEKVAQTVGFPCVVKHPTQGSSIGVKIVRKAEDLAEALALASFKRSISCKAFGQLAENEQWALVRQWADIREDIGLPAWAHSEHGSEFVSTPQQLRHLLLRSNGSVELVAHDSPSELLVEAFVEGLEFSVIVVENPLGAPMALPPTQIIKAAEVFDYRSKYLPGMVRKETPLQLPPADVARICNEAERLMLTLGFEVYARLDGILGKDGNVYFNDPNTTSGMLPGSFFFHQAAEVGLHPSAFLTYIIERSLKQRGRQANTLRAGRSVSLNLSDLIEARAKDFAPRLPVAVVLGGYSTERHISVESGRNVFEKLASGVAYVPTPVFLLDNQKLTEAQITELNIPDNQPFSFWEIPINIVLKDNADDIADKILHHLAAKPEHGFVVAARERWAPVTQKFVGQALLHPRHVSFDQLKARFPFVFLALHGRPGEDGTVQRHLEAHGIPFNGSRPASAALTIDKYATNALLREAGFQVADHQLVTFEDWQQASSKAAFYDEMIAQFGLPLIAKPQDDGCSSAVRKIGTAEELAAYFEAIFRHKRSAIPPAAADVLGLRPSEEFPAKATVLVERFVSPPIGWRQIEVTLGFLTHLQEDGSLAYEVLEPSEALASGKVLSLEEKFLAGEGQNVTPARFSADVHLQAAISQKVMQTIGQVASLAGAEGYGRVDAFVQLGPNLEVKVIIIEINSLPGLTPATCIFHQAAERGYTPAQFMREIIRAGYESASRVAMLP